MASRKLTKGVLCRDAADDSMAGGTCIAFAPAAVRLNVELLQLFGGFWIRTDYVVGDQDWLDWTLADFRKKYPKVRIPKRGTCRETSLMI